MTLTVGVNVAVSDGFTVGVDVPVTVGDAVGFGVMSAMVTSQVTTTVCPMISPWICSGPGGYGAPSTGVIFSGTALLRVTVVINFCINALMKVRCTPTP